MKITVAPASPKTGNAIVQALLEDPRAPSVIGVYRDSTKAPAAFKSRPNFTAVQGDIADPESLDFEGSDVVITISPPQWDKEDPIASAGKLAANVKSATLKAGSVRRLVYVSSAGAQFEHGTGEIKTNRAAEEALQGSAPEVVFVRCAYFMENWAMSLGTLQEDPPFFTSVLSPADNKIPMVSVRDIGRECAAQALATGSKLETNPFAYELFGPRMYSTLDVQEAFEAVLGKTVKVQMVEEDDLDDHFGLFLPPKMIPLLAEMTRSLLPGGALYMGEENDGDDAEAMARGERRKGSDTLLDSFRAMLKSGG